MLVVMLYGLVATEPFFGRLLGDLLRGPSSRRQPRRISARPATRTVVPTRTFSRTRRLPAPASSFRPVTTVVQSAPTVVSSSPAVTRTIVQPGGVNVFPNSNLLDVNVVKETRQAADNAKQILEALKDDSISSPYTYEILASSDCMENINDALYAVEASAQLVESVEPELLYLAGKFKQLENEADVLKQTKASAKILLVLGDLVPALTSSRISTKCDGSPETRIAALTDLANVLDLIANDTNVNIPREAIQFSAKQTSQLATFLTKLVNIDTPEDLCQREDYQTVIYDTIENIMTELAEYMAEYSEERAADITAKAAQFRELAASFEQLGLEQPCGSFDSYASLASALDDLAIIMEEVGLDTLAEELDLSLDF